MIYDNDNQDHPPIQLLIPLCQSVEDVGSKLTWLNAYCLITLRQFGGSFKLSGSLALGQRFGENPGLIRGLGAELSAQAILCGYDLTSIVSLLGRLPIETIDQKPALGILAVLKSMLIEHDPIDLAINSGSQTVVAINLRASDHIDEARRALIDESFEAGIDDVSVTPHGLASYLLESAAVYICTLADIYFPGMETQLIGAWEEWERSIERQMAALSLVPEIGGDTIRIS